MDSPPRPDQEASLAHLQQSKHLSPSHRHLPFDHCLLFPFTRCQRLLLANPNRRPLSLHYDSPYPGPSTKTTTPMAMTALLGVISVTRVTSSFLTTISTSLKSHHLLSLGLDLFRYQHFLLQPLQQQSHSKVREPRTELELLS
jgi:hypothetical protein